MRTRAWALVAVGAVVSWSGLMPVAAAEDTPVPYEMIRVEAHVGGLSQLSFQANTAQWLHLEGPAPGRRGTAEYPTVINDVAWYPTWPDVPDAENRDCNCTSDVFTGVDPALLDLAFAVDLRHVEGLGTVEVVQNPSARNDYTVVLQFDDRELPGMDRYVVEFDLRPEVPPGPHTLRIKAHIDGLSQLILQGDTARWYHQEFAAPGRHFFVNVPTIFNDVEWFPTWPDVPDAENRDCNCYSSTFHGVAPPLPDRAFTVDLSRIRSRGETTVLQQPTAANDYTTIIGFDDVAPSGPAWYIVEFDVPASVPPLQLMRQRVQHLFEHGVLNRGQATALDAKLSGVQSKRHDERLTAACGQLGAFDHQVKAFGRAGILTHEQASWFTLHAAEVAAEVCVT
jgi:hypothetical protein